VPGASSPTWSSCGTKRGSASPGSAPASAPHRDGRRGGPHAPLPQQGSIREEYAAWAKEHPKLDPGDKSLLDARLLPDPDKVRIRVYQTNSTHKSMSAFRQAR
jgi:arginine decarboxylase